MKPLKLSPSSLNIFRECPRCFWLQVHGKRAPGYPPAFQIVIDSILKRYFDEHRKKGLPPLLKGKVPFKLVDQQTASRVRSYITWEDPETGAVLRGKMDDCFRKADGTLVVMDNKSKAGEVKEIYESYLFQLDTYAFLLKKNGHPIHDRGYIVFYIPDRESNVSDGLRLKVDTRVMDLKPGRVLKVFREAVKVAQQAKAPARHKDCEMCEWIKTVGEMD